MEDIAVSAFKNHVVSYVPDSKPKPVDSQAIWRVWICRLKNGVDVRWNGWRRSLRFHAGGVRALWGLSRWVQLYTGVQINFWRSNSIFNLTYMWDLLLQACELCCKEPGEGNPCMSSFQLNVPPLDVPDMYSKPGTPCNNYQGYCDVFQKCREVTSTVHFKRMMYPP